MKNKVIVIGAAGHIGAHTFDYLMTFLDLNDWEVIASGRREVNYFKNNGFEYIQLDICNKDDFKELPKDGVFNLGNGMPVSFEDQIRMIVEIFGSIHQVKSEIVYKPDMPTSRNFVQDITKTREVLGYVPKYDFGSYLEDYKNEMIANRYRNLFK